MADTEPRFISGTQESSRFLILGTSKGYTVAIRPIPIPSPTGAILGVRIRIVPTHSLQVIDEEDMGTVTKDDNVQGVYSSVSVKDIIEVFDNINFAKLSDVHASAVYASHDIKWVVHEELKEEGVAVGADWIMQVIEGLKLPVKEDISKVKQHLKDLYRVEVEEILTQLKVYHDKAKQGAGAGVPLNNVVPFNYNPEEGN